MRTCSSCSQLSTPKVQRAALHRTAPHCTALHCASPTSPPSPTPGPLLCPLSVVPCAERGFIVWEDFLAIATPLARTSPPHHLRPHSISYTAALTPSPVLCGWWLPRCSAAVSPSLLRRVFAAADRDGNGKVSYREFDHCMTHAHTPAQHAHAHAHARNTATSGHRGSSAMTPLH